MVCQNQAVLVLVWQDVSKNYADLPMPKKLNSFLEIPLDSLHNKQEYTIPNQNIIYDLNDTSANQVSQVKNASITQRYKYIKAI